MSRKSVQGSQKLAQTIKLRRNELGLTIEEAAERAGVGTKTWSRYESGESIRQDKCRGVCKALNWVALPGETTAPDRADELQRLKNHEAWSTYLSREYGETAAAAFAAGSDILLDYLQQDLEDLASLPKGTHIGQLSVSMLAADLPQQFLMEYDYNFLYAFRLTILHLRDTACHGGQVIARSVLEELAIYLFVEEAQIYLESLDFEEIDNEWVFDLFGDGDLLTWLYSDFYVPIENIYHFEHWTEQQFW